MVLLVHSRKRHRLKDMGLGLNLGLLLCTCYQSEKFLIRRFRFFLLCKLMIMYLHSVVEILCGKGLAQ
jgi:hypothetical protein